MDFHKANVAYVSMKDQSGAPFAAVGAGIAATGKGALITLDEEGKYE